MTKDKTNIEGIKETNSYDKIEEVLIEYGIQDALFFDSFHELARELNNQVKAECEKYLDEFVNGVKSKASELKRFWVCPECNYEKEYFSKHDSVYCSQDGRKLKLTEKVTFKYYSVDFYEIDEDVENFKKGAKGS